MREEIKTIQEIAEIADSSVDLLRTVLGRSEFTKYLTVKKFNNRRRNGYIFNKAFRQELCDFLELKRQFVCAKRIRDYKESEEKMTRYLFEENADLIEENKQLKQQLEMVCKQYNNLLNHHNECLKAFKNDIQNNEIIKE